MFIITIFIITLLIYLYLRRKIVGKVSKENKKLLVSLEDNLNELNRRTTSFDRKLNRKISTFESYNSGGELSDYFTIMHNKYIIEHKLLVHPDTSEIVSAYYQKALGSSKIKNIDNIYTNKSTLYHFNVQNDFLNFFEKFKESEDKIINDTATLQ